MRNARTKFASPHAWQYTLIDQTQLEPIWFALSTLGHVITERRFCGVRACLWPFSSPYWPHSVPSLLDWLWRVSCAPIPCPLRAAPLSALKFSASVSVRIRNSGYIAENYCLLLSCLSLHLKQLLLLYFGFFLFFPFGGRKCPLPLPLLPSPISVFISVRLIAITHTALWWFFRSNPF